MRWNQLFGMQTLVRLCQPCHCLPGVEHQQGFVHGWDYEVLGCEAGWVRNLEPEKDVGFARKTALGCDKGNLDDWEVEMHME